jgi:RNA polymerase sigma-70 factor (ECF subfamily)
MTVSTPSMSLLIRQQTARSTVETTGRTSTTSDLDAETRTLAAAIARGDENAFRTLYERYHSRLFRLTLVLSHGDESLAQDTVQSVFVTAARKLRHADNEEHLWNWLARIARQQLAKTWRQRQRGLKIVAVEHLPDCPATTEPDSVLEEVLDSALNAMDPEERQLIEHFYFDRLSQKQIAEQLGTTPKAVSSRLERTREKLRGLIKRRLSHET